MGFLNVLIWKLTRGKHGLTKAKVAPLRYRVSTIIDAYGNVSFKMYDNFQQAEIIEILPNENVLSYATAWALKPDDIAKGVKFEDRVKECRDKIQELVDLANNNPEPGITHDQINEYNLKLADKALDDIIGDM
jgi:hypothetical protein